MTWGPPDKSAGTQFCVWVLSAVMASLVSRQRVAIAGEVDLLAPLVGCVSVWLVMGFARRVLGYPGRA